MSNMIAKDLKHNIDAALHMLAHTIQKFAEEQWIKGLSFFQVPAKVAYHTVECLDFYFKENDEEFVWGSHFQGGWWEKSDEELPTQAQILEWLDELTARIDAIFADMSDTELLIEDEKKYRHGKTRIGHYIYAVRHTMHHNGGLVQLAVYHGHQEFLWE